MQYGKQVTNLKNLILKASLFINFSIHNSAASIRYYDSFLYKAYLCYFDGYFQKPHIIIFESYFSNMINLEETRRFIFNKSIFGNILNRKCMKLAFDV